MRGSLRFEEGDQVFHTTGEKLGVIHQDVPREATMCPVVFEGDDEPRHVAVESLVPFTDHIEEASSLFGT